MEESRKKYGKGTRDYAMILLDRGASYEDVSNETGIKVTTLRAYKCIELKRQSSALSEFSNVATNEGNAENIKSNAVAMPDTDDIATHKNEMQHQLNDDSSSKKVSSVAFRITGYELVYYTIQGITCLGVVTALGWVGVGVAIVYFGIATTALLVAKKENKKTSSGEVSMTGVILVELFVGLGCHIVWANQAIWARLEKLPIRVYWVPWNSKGSGEYWVNGDIPFKIACYIAVFMVVSACFCVYATIKMKKEK